MIKAVSVFLCCVVIFGAQMVFADTENTGDGECFPACREGFFCHQGGCISACNPPCETGYTCGSDSQCVPPAPAALPVVSEAEPAPAVETVHDNRLAIRQQRIQKRENYRRVLRLMLLAQVGLGLLGNDSHSFYYGSVGAGLRKNVIPSFGVYGSAAFVFGMEENLYDEDSDFVNGDSAHKVSLRGFSAIVGAYGGPFGRFYIGPVFGVQGLFPSRDETTAEMIDGGETTVEYDTTLVGNFGFGMGVLAGPREEIHIHCRVMSAFDMYEMPIFLLIGASFDLPLDSPASASSGES